MLEHDCAFDFSIEGQHCVAAKILHGHAEVAAGGGAKQIARKSLAGWGTGDAAIRADQRAIEATRAGARQGSAPPSTGWLLALDHHLRRWAGSSGLHRRRSAARHGSAAAIFQSLSTPSPHPRTGGGYPG